MKRKELGLEFRQEQLERARQAWEDHFAAIENPVAVIFACRIRLQEEKEKRLFVNSYLAGGETAEKNRVDLKELRKIWEKIFRIRGEILVKQNTEVGDKWAFLHDDTEKALGVLREERYGSTPDQIMRVARDVWPKQKGEQRDLGALYKF